MDTTMVFLSLFGLLVGMVLCVIGLVTLKRATKKFKEAQDHYEMAELALNLHGYRGNLKDIVHEMKTTLEQTIDEINSIGKTASDMINRKKEK